MVFFSCRYSISQRANVSYPRLARSTEIKTRMRRYFKEIPIMSPLMRPTRTYLLLQLDLCPPPLSIASIGYSTCMVSGNCLVTGVQSCCPDASGHHRQCVLSNSTSNTIINSEGESLAQVRSIVIGAMNFHHAYLMTYASTKTRDAIYNHCRSEKGLFGSP